MKKLFFITIAVLMVTFSINAQERFEFKATEVTYFTRGQDPISRTSLITIVLETGKDLLTINSQQPEVFKIAFKEMVEDEKAYNMVYDAVRTDGKSVTIIVSTNRVKNNTQIAVDYGDVAVVFNCYEKR